MFELNATDYSLLNWIQQAAISAHSLSVRFQQGCLVVHCQTLEQAMKLWDTRALLHMPDKELCFYVNDTFYVGSGMS